MNQFRCTRRKPYPPGTPGNTDLSARQGYYIDAPDQEDAVKQMTAKFPGEAFDVQLWG